MTAASYAYRVPASRLRRYGSAERARLHRQDRWVIKSGRLPSGQPFIAAAVLDYARNFVGPTSYVHRPTNKLGGLPDQARLNLGTLMSIQAAGYISENPTLTGPELVGRLNDLHRRIYVEIGLLLPDLSVAQTLDALARRRPELATGYISHVLVTPDSISATSVGECYVSLGPDVLLGSEKEVDRDKLKLIRKVSNQFGIDYQKAYQVMEPMITQQQFEVQNVPGHRYSYPAVDGTVTLEGGIKVLQLPCRSAATQALSLYTDGVSLDSKGRYRLTDPVHGEATVVRLQIDPQDLSDPQITEFSL